MSTFNGKVYDQVYGKIETYLTREKIDQYFPDHLPSILPADRLRGIRVNNVLNFEVPISPEIQKMILEQFNIPTEIIMNEAKPEYVGPIDCGWDTIFLHCDGWYYDRQPNRWYNYKGRHRKSRFEPILVRINNNEITETVLTTYMGEKHGETKLCKGISC